MAEKCSVDIYYYRAALFDMDGVITDTMPLHFEAWKRAFAGAGIGLEKMDVYLREGMTSMAMTSMSSTEMKFSQFCWTVHHHSSQWWLSSRRYERCEMRDREVGQRFHLP